MVEELVYKVINTLIEQDTIPNEDKEIYIYGLYQGIIIIINILTFIVIGIFFKMLWEIITFLIFYIPLRTYAGGYHARDQLKCYYLSILMILLVLLAIEIVSFYKINILTILIISGALIFSLAPVEDKDKPLSNSEIATFKRITRYVLSVELSFIIITMYMGYQVVALPVVLAIVSASSMVLMGSIKNKIL